MVNRLHQPLDLGENQRDNQNIPLLQRRCRGETFQQHTHCMIHHIHQPHTFDKRLHLFGQPRSFYQFHIASMYSGQPHFDNDFLRTKYIATHLLSLRTYLVYTLSISQSLCLLQQSRLGMVFYRSACQDSRIQSGTV